MARKPKRDNAAKLGGNTSSGQSLPGFEWSGLYRRIAEEIMTGGEPWIVDAVKSLVPDLLPDLFYKSKGAKHEVGNLRNSYDPFSFFALFNYNDGKRKQILDALKGSICVPEIPPLFHGIPSIWNSHVDFPSPGKMNLSDEQRADVVKKLWVLFKAAMEYADSIDQKISTDKEGEDFAGKYDAVKNCYGPYWFTTTSILYEMRPEVFLPLDSNTRKFLYKFPRLPNGEKEWSKEEKAILTGTAPTGEQYLGIIEHVNKLLKNKGLGDGINTFPTLSYNAWKEALLLQSADLLVSSHQLILTGAPGTGKTYTAKQVACKLTKDDPEATEQPHIKSVQFHPGYDYSDFIGGLKPKPTSDNKNVLYPWEPGAFTKFADEALKEYKAWEDKKGKKEEVQKFVFIIDEINRADLSRVFGETFSLLENDYRYPKKQAGLDLPGSGGKQFILPENLYIIGTMNDIDRSVESMDFALRRRFAWLEVTAEESKRIIEVKLNVASKIVANLEAAMDALNEYIRGEKELKLGKDVKERKLSLGSEYELGGAYFTKFGGTEHTKEAYEKLWDNHLKIILNEYLRGEKDKIDLLDALHNVYLKACGFKAGE